MSSGVSVVLCTRNGHSKGYLGEALRSVLAQTSPPVEVIVVDDGSTDETSTEIQRSFPSVTVISNHGHGLAAARNTGLQRSAGAWIAFMDDDDTWHPEKLSTQLEQVASAEDAENVIWASRYATIDAGAPGAAPVTAPTGNYYANWPACLVGCPVAPAGALLPRALVDRIGPFNEQLGMGSAHDYWIRGIAAGASVRYSDVVVLHHRRHSAQMSHTDRRLSTGFAGLAMIEPHLAVLPQATAGRIRSARNLQLWRGLLRTSGVAIARGFWANTHDQRGRIGWRVGAYFVLDSAAARAPLVLATPLLTLAVRLLIGSRPPRNRTLRSHR